MIALPQAAASSRPDGCRKAKHISQVKLLPLRQVSWSSAPASYRGRSWTDGHQMHHTTGTEGCPVRFQVTVKQHRMGTSASVLTLLETSPFLWTQAHMLQLRNTAGCSGALIFRLCTVRTTSSNLLPDRASGGCFGVFCSEVSKGTYRCAQLPARGNCD